MDIEKIKVRITESGKTMDVVVLSKNAHRIQVVLGEGVHSVKCELSPTPNKTATPAQAGGSSLSGDYLVVGHNVDKTDYKGALFIKGESGVNKFSLLWRTGPDARGFGFQTGNALAVTFGPATCGVVAYAIAADGTLDGQWTMLTGGLGSEQARKVD